MPGSEQAHDVEKQGHVSLTLAGDQVGENDMRRLARTLVGEGSQLSYRVRVEPEAVTLLELEEIYGRGHDVIAYQVLINNVPTAFRTWQGSGAGPVHYFVCVPPTGLQSVKVTLRNQGKAAWSLGRLWAWSDFQSFFTDSGMETPFYLAPTIALSWHDSAADLSKLSQIKSSLGTAIHAKPAWTTWLAYAGLSERQLQERINYVLRIAEESGMPVQLAFDTWWGNTPNGSDGQGGFWTDVQYQQVVYNATKHGYQLSVPNRWSSVPWLSVNHPALNAWKADRLRAATQYLSQSLRRLKAQGKPSPILALNLDNEPVYWASGNAGLGSDLLLADFNSHTVEAARRDGVALDPANGLTIKERQWLSGNLLRYNSMIANAAAAGLGRDSSLVNKAGAHPADDLLRNNLYTQAMVASGELQYPRLDSVYPFWETAAPAAARVGGEWNGDSPREYEAVSHQIALGRNAAVNAECGSDANRKEAVRPAYALAQRYLALYNYPIGKMDVAVSELSDLTQNVRTFLYEPVLREETYRDDAWKARVAAHGGLQQDLIGNTGAIALFPASSSAIGFLTYQIDAPQGTFAEGLSVELYGRAFVSHRKDPRVSIAVYVGSSPDPAAMTLAGTMFDHGDINQPVRIDISHRVRGTKTVYVRLELDGRTLPPEVLSWCSLYQTRFTTPWPASITSAVLTQETSLAEARRRNLTVSWRRDAELAIAELAAQSQTQQPCLTRPGALRPAGYEQQARQAYKRGAYAKSYSLANQGLCVLLPATFEVAVSGALDPYAIHVETAVPVTCTVHACRREEIHLEAQSEAPATVTFRIGGLPAGARYTRTTDGANLVLRPALPGNGGTLKASRRGEITLSLATTLIKPPATPSLVRGLLGGHGGTGAGELIILPDTQAGREVVPLSDLTTIRRGAEGQPALLATSQDLLIGDQVSAQVGPDGTATEIIATYVLEEGIVQEFGQLTPFAMPYVIIKNKGARHIVDLSAPLHTPKINGGNIKSLPLGSVDITPGNRVRYRCAPQTGRVFELWKLE